VSTRPVDPFKGLVIVPMISPVSRGFACRSLASNSACNSASRRNDFAILIVGSDDIIAARGILKSGIDAIQLAPAPISSNLCVTVAACWLDQFTARVTVTNHGIYPTVLAIAHNRYLFADI